MLPLPTIYRMFTRDWQAEPDNHGLMQFGALLVALSGVVVVSAGAVAVSGST